MSWGRSATSAATAAAVAATASVPTLASSVDPPLCFACSRCEYPICTGADIILSEVPGGTTEYAFHYSLDYLLDLDDDVAVPCYCGEETVDTAIIVSEKMLDEPLPPAAKVMCMESIVESRKFLKEQQTATLAKLTHQQHGKKEGSSAGEVAPVAARPGEAAVAQETNTAAVAAAEHHGESQRHRSQSSGRESPSQRQMMPPRRGSSAAISRLSQAAAREPALGPEHDLQLAESIPEHGAPTTSVPPAETGAATHQQQSHDVRSEAQRTSEAERGVESGDADAARAERIRTLLAPERVLRPVRRYGATSEARVDMVCVKHEVLGYGLAISRKDRSAAAVSADTGAEASRGGAAGGSGGGRAVPAGPDSVASRLPPHIIEAASQAPPRTAWGPPGNLTVEEAFMIVTRATSSAQGQWFVEYVCEDRVECPDCHLPLGFLFEKTVPQMPPSGLRDSTERDDEEENSEEDVAQREDDATIHRDFTLPPGRVPLFASLANERHRARQAVLEAEGEGEEDRAEARRPVDGAGGSGNPSGTPTAAPRRPRSDVADADDSGEGVAHGSDGPGTTEPKKRAKTEKNGRGAETVCAAGVKEAAEAFPAVFVGLELKRIKQIGWGLREFQERYTRAQSLHSFRAMFPEAEELQSLYNRLSALRTQSELYNNLLRKHKEQNDVQSSLLVSQKDRLCTYEEKLKTMQQIISAQKMQLEMQNAQMKQQEELIRSHRQQVLTQAQQIEVEQMLLSEQAKTIESQREQIRLMRAHLSVKADHERLIEHQRQASTQPRDEQPPEEGLEAGAEPPRGDGGAALVAKRSARGEEETAKEAPAPPDASTLAPAPPPGSSPHERYESSIRHTRELLAAATRTLADRQAALAALSVGREASAASPRPTASPTQPPAHLRGVFGTASQTSNRAPDEEQHPRHGAQGGKQA